MTWRQRRRLPLSDTEEPRWPRDDHSPPLDWEPSQTAKETQRVEASQSCGDCYYPFDGNAIVRCEVHKDEETPISS